MNNNTSMQKAFIAWQQCAALRGRRLRMKRYTFGDQWGDIVTVEGEGNMTEREQRVRKGENPVTNNIIRQLVKTVVGCYRASRKASGGNTDIIETDARTFEEYLISGCAIQRVISERNGERMAATALPVSPARFFIGSHSCHTGDDVELIGEIHDLSLMQVMMRHSHGDRNRALRIREIYSSEFMQNRSRALPSTGESHNDNLDFYHAGAGLCRLIETWTLDSTERLRCHDEATGRFYIAPMSRHPALLREKARRRKKGIAPLHIRWELAPQWRCRFFAPTGETIDEYTAPAHPYIFRLYPFIDGEIHSFVEDVIEQQRNINRLLTLNDRILSTAAKGVLLFPDNQESRIMPIGEVAENWALPDGMVAYHGVPGLPGPQQLHSSPGNLGVSAMVDQQLKLISEVSGVTGALRGFNSTGDGSAQLYRERHDSALVALSDIFDSFDSFIAARDRKLSSFDS